LVPPFVPRTSVVNADCRSWGILNLWICVDQGGNLVNYADVDNDPGSAHQALQHDKRDSADETANRAVKASLRDRG
jgi:hypothetical protein